MDPRQSVSIDPSGSGARVAAGRAGFAEFDAIVTQRLAEREFDNTDRRKALALCRRLYRIAMREHHHGFARAVAEAAGGAARQGLAPRLVYRLAGLALSHLGMRVPVGLGSALKQSLFDGTCGA